MRAAVTTLVGICFVESVLFVVLYARRSPWRSTPMGRHLMTLIAVLGTIFGLFLLSRLVGPLPGGVWVAALTALALALGRRIHLLLRAQRGC